MISRTIEAHVLRVAEKFPVVTITGPRQSGKTTLCKNLFPKKTYVTLEEPDVRARALDDPRGFLKELSAGAILDEVQRAPELLSYLQGMVDDAPNPGRFILTGSQNFNLLASISQSLAGRTTICELLPLSLAELPKRRSMWETIFIGGYPRLHSFDISPQDWLPAYVQTYIERDVREVLNIGDLASFQTFMGLCAGRTAQILNLTTLGSDCGINQKTAKSWLSVLQTSFLAFPLRPFFHNLGKRWIKSPKLHFFDSGILCFLLGIREADQLLTHPLRGAIFETWLVAEIYKSQVNHGLIPDLYHGRDSKGNEVDLISLAGSHASLIEVKSGQTTSTDFVKPLEWYANLLSEKDALITSTSKFLVYGGEEKLSHREALVLPWSDLNELMEDLR